MSVPFDSGRTRGILLDIEGTTTPLDFVYKTLFPFASTRVEEFLTAHIQEDEIRALVEELRQHHQRDAESEASLHIWCDETTTDRVRSAASYVRWLIARDSKITPLKALQGKIWAAGYHSGDLRGAVYRDVAPALARWRAQGRRLAIFSSGSVLAQKLLFAYSTVGDLTVFLDGFFDTTTGLKREAGSYRQIAAELSIATSEGLFLSDVTAELDAARAAGMQTALALRPGVPLPAASDHPTVRGFDELFP
ncbi:MAG TPA: acireductone synthase [Candidatus Sulfotelmatobacter sp.]|nr:acireductone synthase [Candidatus Sulfotelmatobacter sp.]